MIEKIAHLADIHIPSSPERHFVYRQVFSKIYESLKKENPDRIVVAGDLFHDFIDISNEAEILAGEFLSNLAQIAKVISIRGNHDIRKKNLDRLDSISPVIKLLNSENITYYDKSGCYEDENIKWVVFHHGEKDENNNRYNPWNYIENKDENFTYIDLIHEPLNGCTLYNGFQYIRKTSITLDDLKGDYSLMGDIHLRQFFKNKTKGYSGNPVQLSFGEDVSNHGYLLWDIKNKNIKEINIKNDYNYINLYIKENTDYNNLNLVHPELNENSLLKIHWTEYPAFLNVENENKIKKYIDDKYNIKKIKFDKTTIYNDILSSSKINENIDVSNQEIQRKLFIEFLKDKKYEQDFIDEILNVDDIVNQRLNLNNIHRNVLWSIKKIWIDNFKSYSDGIVLDFHEKDGIYQINGENRQGKSTILDAITYGLYGTTFYTDKMSGAKIEKHGDNRYINNKRDLDYCQVKILLPIDGEDFLLIRKTERKLDKNGNVKSATTIFELKTPDGKPLNEEIRVKTQKKLDELLGTFEDFIRITFINSDNINSMFSMGRADFIDQLLKDAGYDIFELKLAEFKKYKDENQTKKLNIDFNLEKNKYDSLLEEIEKLSEELKQSKDKEKILIKNIGKIQLDKENLLKQLHPIEKLDNLDISEIINKISTYDLAIKSNLKLIEEIEAKCVNLTKEFDEIKYSESVASQQKLEINIMDLKAKIQSIDTEREKELMLVEKLDNSFLQLKKQEVSKIELEINSSKSNKINIEKDFNSTIQTFIQKIELEIKDLNNEINIKNEKLNALTIEVNKIIKEIDTCKNSTECPTCKRAFDNAGQIQEHINELEKNKNDIKADGKPIFEEKQAIQQKIDDKKTIIQNLNNKNIDTYNLYLSSEYKKFINDIKTIETNQNMLYSKIRNIEQDIFEENSFLYTKYHEFLKEKEEKLKNCKLLIDNKTSVKNSIDVLISNNKTLQEEIMILENKKSEYNQYIKLNEQKIDLINNNKDININIEKANLYIEKYKLQLEYIKQNERIEEDIKKLNLEQENEKEVYDNLIFDIKNIETNIALKNQESSIIKKKLDIYTEQVKQERIFDEYFSCIHRDGIPTYLLKKSLNIINNKLRDLMSGVDFLIYFNDNLTLKFLDKGVEQNVLESSGSERTISAVVLKSSIREINNKSKPSFIMLDEIFGKLKNEYVDVMRNIIENMKKDIKQILIIEHKEIINFDYLIEVNKDDDGVSVLKLMN